MKKFEIANLEADKIIEAMDERAWRAIISLAPENSLVSKDPYTAKKSAAKTAIARIVMADLVAEDKEQ